MISRIIVTADECQHELTSETLQTDTLTQSFSGHARTMRINSVKYCGGQILCRLYNKGVSDDEAMLG